MHSASSSSEADQHITGDLILISRAVMAVPAFAQMPPPQYATQPVAYPAQAPQPGYYPPQGQQPPPAQYPNESYTDAPPSYVRIRLIQNHDFK